MTYTIMRNQPGAILPFFYLSLFIFFIISFLAAGLRSRAGFIGTFIPFMKLCLNIELVAETRLMLL